MASDKRLDQVKLVNSAESVLVVNGDQVEKATLAGFANSMGSSVPLQQTSEQVNITGLYARTSDGKMVELTKESVASVMAGLMGNPIAEKGEYKGDANELNVAGVYACEGLATNVPESIGYLIHFKTGRTAVPDAQQFIEWRNSATYVRSKDGGGVWSIWQRIDNFGYNTLAELSSGVAEQNSIYNVNRTLNSGESYDTGKSFGLIVLSAPSSGLVGVYIAYAGNVLMVKGSDETSLNSVYEFSRTSSGTVNLKNKSEGQRLINLTIISAR